MEYIDVLWKPLANGDPIRQGLVATPRLEEINQDTQFESIFISEGAFEALWLERAPPAKQ